MKRPLASLALIASVSVIGCKPKPPAPSQQPPPDMSQSQQPQPYQPPANSTGPETTPAPEPAPMPSSETQSQTRTTAHRHHVKYVVKEGDTLTKIAKDHHTSLKRIKALNPGIDPDHIKVGQTITLP